jgi:hypothetical protein
LFSLPYIATLFCIFTAWTWGGVITGGACAAGGAILAPIAIPAALDGIGFTAGAAALGASGTLAAGAISGAAGFIYADDDC